MSPEADFEVRNDFITQKSIAIHFFIYSYFAFSIDFFAQPKVYNSFFAFQLFYGTKKKISSK